MERGRSLADLLAIPAGKFLPYRFDHLPLAGDCLQRPGHVLAQLAQAGSATALASRRRVDHHALAREMFGEAISFGPFAGEARHRGGLWRQRVSAGELIFGGARFQLLELQRQLIDKSVRALRAGTVDLPLQLGDPQLLMGDQGQVFGCAGARRPPVPRHQHRVVRPRSRILARSIVSAALSASMSSGRAARSASMTQIESQIRPGELLENAAVRLILRRWRAARCGADSANQCLRAYKTAVTPICRPRRRPAMATGSGPFSNLLA